VMGGAAPDSPSFPHGAVRSLSSEMPASLSPALQKA